VPDFIPGVELARRFYVEAVRPVLDEEFGGLVHSAARIGTGSDVLGYDDATSTDHDFGPRVRLFLQPADHLELAQSIRDALARRLPAEFAGYQTDFDFPWKQPSGGPVHHVVEVFDLRTYFTAWLGLDPRGGLGPRDWLALPQQLLLSAVAGEVFHDGLGELERIRAAISWYPDDVWRYQLACGWGRIGQEEHLAGRCLMREEDVGAAIVITRLVRDVMGLCFLMERRYAPYAKWFGTAFATLACADEMFPLLRAATGSADIRRRFDALGRAFVLGAEMHNRLGLTDPLDASLRPFHTRPFLVLDAWRFRDALLATIADPEVRALEPIGAIDQFVDSTDILSHAGRSRHARAMYG
jgi:hypothetical protein